MITCCYTEISYQWNEQELAAKLVLLPEKLQQQALRKRQWIDKQLAIAGKVLLMRVLRELDSQALLADLKYNTHHRPYLENGPDFNIAHSGNMVVCCGTNDGQIGIDIEEVKEIDLNDYTDYFTPNEWEKINNYPNRYDGFYNFWTRKEAVLKALGTGFHTPLSTVDVTEDAVSYDGITYHIRPLNIHADYKCHVASTEPTNVINLSPISI
jgi:4'-phosphopantetheinyl transferase